MAASWSLQEEVETSALPDLQVQPLPSADSPSSKPV